MRIGNELVTTKLDCLAHSIRGSRSTVYRAVERTEVRAGEQIERANA